MNELKKAFIIKFLEEATETQLNKVFAKVVDIELGNDIFTPYIPSYPNQEKINLNDLVTITSTGTNTDKQE